jgi:hypothetical protein
MNDIRAKILRALSVRDISTKDSERFDAEAEIRFLSAVEMHDAHLREMEDCERHRVAARSHFDDYVLIESEKVALYDRQVAAAELQASSILSLAESMKAIADMIRVSEDKRR